MANATEVAVEASVKALEFREAAWDADEHGRGSPDASALSDPALLAVLRYERCDLPTGASKAVQVEATQRGLLAGLVDRWLPWIVLVSLPVSGGVITLELLLG